MFISNKKHGVFFMTDERGRPPNNGTDHLIRTIRMAMGLKSNDLAKLCQLEYFTIHRAETGLTIRPDKVYKIAKALNISPDIIFYSIGQIPEDKIELMKKDPLSFKEKIDELCEKPWRLTATTDYINNIKEKMNQAKKSPEINKILSRLMPSE